jgi:hypothetical protein
MTQVICNHACVCSVTTCPHYEPHIEGMHCLGSCSKHEGWCHEVQAGTVCIPEDELTIIETEEPEL